MSSSTPRLFVPMNLQGLLLNEPAINTQGGFQRWTLNYGSLIQSFISPERNYRGIPDEGVYLHWILPDALTHGRDKTQLFSITTNVNSIINDLDEGKINPALNTAFANINITLSNHGTSISQTQENRQWIIADWPKGSRYLVEMLDSSSLNVLDANVKFPMVPNRWLVTRLQPEETEIIPPVSWLIQSDYLDPENDKTGNEFPDPFSEQVKITFLGRSDEMPLPQGQPANPSKLFLQAIGAGDVTFSAYTPTAKNVFSFHDPMKNVPDNTPLSYFVVGWYSLASEDLLAGVTTDTWCQKLESLNWTLPPDKAPPKCENTIPKTPPQTCLFHGMFHTMKWQTKTKTPPSRPNNSKEEIFKNVKVAIGKTNIDAVAALVEYKAKEKNETVNTVLLEAFQYGLLNTLNEPDGIAKVQDAMKQGQYGSSPGGTLWEIVPAQEESATQSAPDLSPFAKGLAQLNSDQKQLDEAYQQLQPLQQELYFRWWKGKRLSGSNPFYQYTPLKSKKDPNFPSIEEALKIGSEEYNDLCAQITQKQIDIQKLLTKPIPNPHDPASIENYANNILKLSPSLELKPINMPRFWHPKDPVVLVSGLEPSTPPQPSGPLQCRLNNQLITGIKVGSSTIDVNSLTGKLPNLGTYEYIPKEVQSICIENFFSDPNNASYIASIAKQDSEEVKKAIQNKTWSTATTVSQDPISAVTWQQAWVPLFLNWTVLWYPTYTQSDSSWNFNRNDWEFDGKKYCFSGSVDASKEENGVQLSGLTFLTPSAGTNFNKQLQSYLEQHTNPDLKYAEDLLGQNLLSQSLGGFYDQLIMQLIDQNLFPDPSIAQLVENQYHTRSNPEPGEVDGTFPYFFPEKAGFFLFKDLQIVDRFGQSIDLLYANENKVSENASNNYQTFVPIRAASVTPDPMVNFTAHSAQLIEERVGVVQSSRLDFRFVDASADSAEIGYFANANPICGWVLPNHIDSGLMIYDAQGNSLGEIGHIEGSQKVNWHPAPASASPILDPKSISNTHLQNFVFGLVQMGKSFENFMKVIDETLWFINPLGGRNDQHLSVLIGRPLALVRIKLQLTSPNPAFNQSWLSTFSRDEGGFSKIPFSIRLGSVELRDDGLLGYYCGSDSYTEFNAVHVPSAISQDSYIHPIDQQNYLSTTFGSDPLYVTLLIDPRGVINAHTGILPPKSITLPERFISSALQAMETTFRIGPIITDPIESNTIRLLKPSTSKGSWSWIERKDANTFEDPLAITKADSVARLPDAAEAIREGWLKFTQNASKEN